MQTTDIKTLIDYLYWRRDRVLAGADALGPEAFVATAGAASRDLRGTLVHELDVERSWRLRLAGAPDADWDQTLQDGEYPAVEALREAWDRDEAEMRPGSRAYRTRISLPRSRSTGSMDLRSRRTWCTS